MFNSAHLSKSVVNFNLIMLSKPKYVVILTGLSCSVVAGGTSHFYSFFSVNVLASQAQAKDYRNNFEYWDR